MYFHLSEYSLKHCPLGSSALRNIEEVCIKRFLLVRLFLNQLFFRIPIIFIIFFIIYRYGIFWYITTITEKILWKSSYTPLHVEFPYFEDISFIPRSQLSFEQKRIPFFQPTLDVPVTHIVTVVKFVRWHDSKFIRENEERKSPWKHIWDICGHFLHHCKMCKTMESDDVKRRK